MSEAICGVCRDPAYRYAHAGYGLYQRHCEERSDEAIQLFLVAWIASLSLAMTMSGV